jgi:ABC-type lipoprotein export system ATPase subunit
MLQTHPGSDVIRLEGVYKTYQTGEVKVPVLKGITLNIERGDMVALMGASGSGKTTLMNILGCLDRPTAGQYWFDGEEVSGYSVTQRAQLRSRKIGFVFQNYSLLPRTSALDNLQVPLAYLPVRPSRREGRARAEALLARVGLQSRLHHVPSQLSGGEQQRVAIARALINGPVLLLADEPTGNLDTTTSGEILSLFQKLNVEGLTILLVTHSPDVAGHARRIIRIRDGRIEGSEVPAPPAAAVPAIAGGGTGLTGHEMKSGNQG